jgi:hypothetical protein
MINNNMLYTAAENLRANTTFYMAFSSDTAFTPDPTATSLSGEFGDRLLCGVTYEALNEVVVSAIRQTTDVINTVNGDRLWGIALFDSVGDGSLLQSFYVPGLLHTTSYDFGMTFRVEVNRR